MDNMDCIDMGKTFQISLDAFLEESHPAEGKQQESYQQALATLEESRLFRGWDKKQAIANKALEICPDCVEAYMLLATYEQDIVKRVKIYKEGMELATLNLGKDFFLRQVSDFYVFEEAKAFFQIKYMYASTLYEMGYMRKAQIQFQDILNLNPSDHYDVHVYLYVLALYFEEFVSLKELLQKYHKNRTIDQYVQFLLYMKMESYLEAKQMIPCLSKANLPLYNMLTYRSMNMTRKVQDADAGSEEEAAYLYHMLNKVLHSMEYLPDFLVKNE